MYPRFGEPGGQAKGNIVESAPWRHRPLRWRRQANRRQGKRTTDCRNRSV